MLVISLLILLVSNSLAFIKKNINSISINRIASITLIYSAILSYNSLYFQSIGKGIGIFNGLFQITISTQIIEILIFSIGAIILLAWPFTLKFQSLPPAPEENRGNNDLHSQPGPGPARGGRALPSPEEYSIVSLFSVLGSSLLICSIDLISMYLSIELQSFALYILATLNKDSHSSVSAGLKYFLLGGLSSCFILLGAGLIYSYTGLTNFESLYTLLSVASIIPSPDGEGLFTEINRGFTIGLIFTIVGFLFKVSAAPFHNWSPDVYDESPSIITVWLSIMAKLSIFIFLLEALALLSAEYGLSSPITGKDPSTLFNIETVKILLLISSLLSLIIGTVVGLAQVKIRRLLAYSSISHVGFLLLALAINTEKSVESFIFYLGQYSITSLNIFLILLAYAYLVYQSILSSPSGFGISVNESVESKNNEHNQENEVQGLDINYISQLRGQYLENPVLSISFAICLLSMAGIPPLIGFFSKQFVLYASIQDGYYFISIVAIVVSVISASYYLKIIKIIFFDSSPVLSLKGKGQGVAPTEGENSHSASGIHPNSDPEVESSILTNSHSFVISLLTFIILLFFINPSILLYGSQLIALNLF